MVSIICSFRIAITDRIGALLSRPALCDCLPSDVRLGCRRLGLWVLCAGLMCLAGCDSNQSSRQGASGDQVLRLATTTSTRDSGLLDRLLPPFEAANDCRVDVIAVGTGAALRLGETGDVDVVLVHARRAERAFIDAKHGVRHEEVMYNHFVILGPGDDPAAIRGRSPSEALASIARSKQRFVSRGDDSGTHQREVRLWADLPGGRPSWNGYLEIGQGMGPALLMAHEKKAYILADQATYINYQHKIGLMPLVTSGENLRNPYAAIVVSPEKHAKINGLLAQRFVDFLISVEAQSIIDNYRIRGQQLFTPSRTD